MSSNILLKLSLKSQWKDHLFLENSCENIQEHKLPVLWAQGTSQTSSHQSYFFFKVMEDILLSKSILRTLIDKADRNRAAFRLIERTLELKWMNCEHSQAEIKGHDTGKKSRWSHVWDANMAQWVSQKQEEGWRHPGEHPCLMPPSPKKGFTNVWVRGRLYGHYTFFMGMGFIF